MTKTLANFAFIIASLIVVLIFVTSMSYSQLIIAVVLYSTLVFIGFMVFPRKSPKPAKIKAYGQPKPTPTKFESPKPKVETTYVADFDRRTFIKLIGATGISFFLFSIFGRGIENLFLSRNSQAGINPATSGDQFTGAGSSPTDGYKITEVDEGDVSYYGFTNKEGGWLIMQEQSTEGTFRYAKGDSGFPDNWSDRLNLKYDYFYNLF